MMLLPFALAAAVQQYRGTFLRVKSAARAISIALYVLFGLAIFGLITIAGEAIVDGTSLRLIAPILFMFGLVSGLALGAARLNGNWSRELQSVSVQRPHPIPSLGVSLRELLAGLTLICVMTGVTSWIARSVLPPFAEGVAASEAPVTLPAGARDICYANGPRGAIACEFTTDEASFRKWVASGIGSIESLSAKVHLAEITTPASLLRYHCYAPELVGTDRALVGEGLEYHWSKEDRGVHAVFDRVTGRAYYHSHSH